MKSIINYTSATNLDKAPIKDGSVYLVDASAGDVVITLPDLADNSRDGTTFGFVKVDSSANSVTVQTSGAFIFQDSQDYTGMEGESPYTYHEFAIIDGQYKAIVGEWLPVL